MEVQCFLCVSVVCEKLIVVELDTKTPGLSSQHGHGHFIGSPDEYFRMPPRVRQASRWKEDWEELELLVRNP